MRDIRNTKIDLRDGLDLQCSANVKQFIKAIGYTDKKKFCGWGSDQYSDVIKYYIENASFIFIDSKGMLSLGYNEDYSYFKSKDPKGCKEIKMVEVVSIELEEIKK